MSIVGQGKLLTKQKARNIWFLKAYLGWTLTPMYQNYQVSQYFFLFIPLLCAKMSRMT